tara:strand:- start:28 stop:318 length:291 start_codon:yes stop_codon:yes gene_type:complete
MNSYRKYLIDLLLKVNPELDKLILYTLSTDKLINLKNKEMNKANWKKISYDDFLYEYVVPNEDWETRENYLKGNVDFDNDYLLEIANHHNLIIKDL